MKKLTLEYCKNYAENCEYIINENSYFGCEVKMKFIHNVESCNSSFLMSWDDFYGGSRCPTCANKAKGSYRKLDMDLCKKYSEENGYILNEDSCFASEKKINFIHKICGFDFSMSWHNFYSGCRCPKCAGHLKPTIEFCKDEALRRGYALQEDIYQNSQTKMNFIHRTDKCNFSFQMKWNKFYNGNQGCPLCASKRLESKIANILKKYFQDNYNAVSEFKECVNPKTGFYLPYDICFDTQWERIYVEIHGIQHYKFNAYFHKTLDGFEYSQYKDKIKKQHGKKNGIYIEIDLRKIKTSEDAIDYINSFL